MKSFTIKIKRPKYKPRSGVIHTKKEKSKKGYSRKTKHKDATNWTKGDD